ncbi:MAG TPA: EscU/YscU/HrcU family type III secretion system export apparatus switch protein [Bacillales bacterium]|nr:EscU/YscU/HrcU family type III secretion system export apparatus switch protein [Bacillales bacterium]
MKGNEQNKRKEAVALSYTPDQDAPRVVAKGKGKVAENIIERAKENQVPIKEDPSLMNLLSDLKLNESIPEELYKVVAEVFAFIYKADNLVKQKNNG